MSDQYTIYTFSQVILYFIDRCYNTYLCHNTSLSLYNYCLSILHYIRIFDLLSIFNIFFKNQKIIFKELIKNTRGVSNETPVHSIMIKCYRVKLLFSSCNIHNSTSCNIAISILNINIEFSVSC